MFKQQLATLCEETLKWAPLFYNENNIYRGQPQSLQNTQGQMAAVSLTYKHYTTNKNYNNLHQAFSACAWL